MDLNSGRTLINGVFATWVSNDADSELTGMLTVMLTLMLIVMLAMMLTVMLAIC